MDKEKLNKEGAQNWKVLTTNFIPINAYGNLTYQVSMFGSHTNSIHSKMIYYDSYKSPIQSSFMYFNQKNGDSFSDMQKKSDLIPEGTRYIKHQFLATANTDEVSYFLLDNIKIDQVHPDKTHKNTFEIFGNSYSASDHKTVLGGQDVQVNIDKGDSTRFISLKTLPIEVGRDVMYQYKINIEGRNINSLSSRVLYSINDVEKSSKYGVEEGILILDPGSRLYTELDLPQTSNYTIATKVRTCEKCSSLGFKIGDTTRELSLQNNKPEFKWLYFNASLVAGKADFEIHSNSETELDKLIISSDTKNASVNGLFSPDQTPSSSSTIIKNKEVNPRKHMIDAESDTPFILRFMEPYNPLWKAYINGKEYSPIPVYFESARVSSKYYFPNIISSNYPAINGFLVDQTGKLPITIEYKPLKWLYVGAAASIIVLVVSLSYLALRHLPIGVILTNAAKIYSIRWVDICTRRNINQQRNRKRTTRF
jgi:hypothetical protein